MCIIAFGVKGDLKREELENCIINNPDGFFLMAYKDGEREPYLYERTLKSDVILKRFDEIDDNDNFILHARIKTHGSSRIPHGMRGLKPHARRLSRFPPLVASHTGCVD